MEKWIKIDGKKIINFSLNNFPGIDNSLIIPEFINNKITENGFNFSHGPRVHVINTIHKKLEKSICDFFETEDALINRTCYEANIGLFASILSENDVIFSDALNHASIIDGIRLSKAKRYIVENRNYSELEEKLKFTSNKYKRCLIVTNGSFSMDGTIADLKKIKELSIKYNALVMVDETYSMGTLGKKGKGASEYNGLTGKIDIITGSFGTALGGFNGGFTTGKKEIIDKIRKKSRTYCFSSLLSPVSVFTAQNILESLEKDLSWKQKLEDNTGYFKNKMKKYGFPIVDNTLPLVPIIFKNVEYGKNCFKKLLENGIYISFFTYPKVPENVTRLRIEISAIHSKSDIDKLLGKILLLIDRNELYYGFKGSV